jgi:hypothetical protein
MLPSVIGGPGGCLGVIRRSHGLFCSIDPDVRLADDFIPLVVLSFDVFCEFLGRAGNRIEVKRRNLFLNVRKLGDGGHLALQTLHDFGRRASDFLPVAGIKARAGFGWGSDNGQRGPPNPSLAIQQPRNERCVDVLTVDVGCISLALIPSRLGAKVILISENSFGGILGRGEQHYDDKNVGP